jgi:hypothetical protein
MIRDSEARRPRSPPERVRRASRTRCGTPPTDGLASRSRTHECKYPVRWMSEHDLLVRRNSAR